MTYGPSHQRAWVWGFVWGIVCLVAAVVISCKVLGVTFTVEVDHAATTRLAPRD